MDSVAPASPRKLILVGNPNVGKSVIFGYLTGRYVTVANYPGTTVEISRGTMRLNGLDYLVIDTPGVNSLVPQSEDERITRDIILREQPDLIVQVADAKNLRRTLLITSQLAEFGRPLLLVLNMMDEARERGIEIDTEGISELFGIPIVETVATFGEGLPQLRQKVAQAQTPRNPLLNELPELAARLAQLNQPVSAEVALPPAGTTVTPAAAYAAGTATAIDVAASAVANGNSAPAPVPLLLALECLQSREPSLRQQIELSLGPARLAALNQLSERFRAERKRSLAAYLERERAALLDQWTIRFKLFRVLSPTEAKDSRAFRFSFPFLLLGLAILLENEIARWLDWPSLQKLGEAWVQSVAPGIMAYFSGSATILGSTLVGLPNDEGIFENGLLQSVMHLLTMIAPVVVPFAFTIKQNRRFAHTLGNWTRMPRSGIFILLIVLLLIFEFVGYIGAQTLVGLLEEVLFGTYLTPALKSIIPAGVLFDLLVGEYGLISVGFTYAVAIVLPVVSTFFIAFSLLEDSGYLPRLAILSDRIFRVMGLNGKAILPMVLGLGCDTMATMTTRILSTPKERLIATILLALGVPCSAQLGVILGIGAGIGSLPLLIIFGVVLSQLVLVGFLSAQIIKGQRGDFIFEIPPIRVPQFKNVWLKTKHRVIWFLREAVPLFILGTLILFTLDRLQLGVSGLDRSVFLTVGALLALAGYVYWRQQRRLEWQRRPLTLAGQRDQTRTLALKQPPAAWVKAAPLAGLAVLIFFLDRVMALAQLAPRSGLAALTDLLRPILAGILYLPAETAKVFVLGFLRRDYGAAGLFQMSNDNLLTTQQVVVSLIVMTLFIPCIANFFVIVKEQGVRRGLLILAFITPYAILVGGVVSLVLRTFHFLE